MADLLIDTGKLIHQQLQRLQFLVPLVSRRDAPSVRR